MVVVVVVVDIAAEDTGAQTRPIVVYTTGGMHESR